MWLLWAKRPFRGDQRCCSVFLRAQREERCRVNSKENYSLPPSAASMLHFILFIRKQAIQAEEHKVILGTFLDEGEHVCAEHRRINQEALFAAAGRTVKPIVCLQKWAKIKVRSDRTSAPRLMTQNSNRWHKEISKNVILLLLPPSELTIINLLSQRGGDSRLREQINWLHRISFKSPEGPETLLFMSYLPPLFSLSFITPSSLVYSNPVKSSQISNGPIAKADCLNRW